MKNKNLGVFLLILIGLIIIIGAIYYFCFGTRYESVERFSICEVKDALGNELADYENNKLPFIIFKSNDSKVLVNGKEYTSGERIYKPGRYEIKIYNKDTSEKAIINICDIERKPENEYNIYSVAETLPNLFTAMHIMQNPEQKGFYWTKRPSTINIDELKKNCPNLDISDYIGTTTNEEYFGHSVPEMRKYIKKILLENPDAHFNLYIDESRAYVEYYIFSEIGFTDARYDMYLYSDGTLSYVSKYELMEKDKYDKFLAEKENYNKLLHLSRSNIYSTERESLNDYASFLLLSTLKDNIHYNLQYPEMLKFEDERVSTEMKKANLVKIVASEELSKISNENKKAFFNLVNLDKEKMDKEYFNVADDTKYLIITGTVPHYGDMSKEQFENVIKQVSNKYKDEYVILFKPHPRSLPDEEQTKFLNNLNIKILPGKMPMEAICFTYPNLKLGGFGSSLYMSLDAGKALFFFEEKKEDLVEPLNILYDDLFKDAEFIY